MGVNATDDLDNAVSYYAVSTGYKYSYDYSVSGGTGLSVSEMDGVAPAPSGGVSPMPVDAVNPTSLVLNQYANNACPILIGTFTLDVNGNLWFTAGTVPALPQEKIEAVAADPLNSGTATVSFTTTDGFNYQLLYSTSLGAERLLDDLSGHAAGQWRRHGPKPYRQRHL